jgi:hypothetical protein
MKSVIGFFLSKTTGFNPSRTPPWGVARKAADDADATADAVLEAASIIVDDMASYEVEEASAASRCHRRTHAL